MQASDTSQTYLLFQTLLLLFWPHSCMIWTKLTQTDAVFSRATSLVFFCAGFWIFRYAGKIHKKYIKNQHSRSFDDAKGGSQGSQGAPRRVHCAAQPLAMPHTPWCPTFALFLPPARKLQNKSHFSNLRHRAAATLCPSPGELIWRPLWPPVRGNHRHRHHHRLSITPP